MFATDRGLSLLAESKTWFVDGNFSLAPEFFKQLYMILVHKNAMFMTAVDYILECKNQSTYEKIFSVILKECEDLIIYPDLRFLHLDFELAVKNILGSHITINGCFYHLCQSIHRKLQKLGLSTIYKENIEFRNYCGMIDSLAFLPLNKVLDRMAYLKENIPPHADEILIYFDSNYVNGSYK